MVKRIVRNNGEIEYRVKVAGMQFTFPRYYRAFWFAASRGMNVIW